MIYMYQNPKPPPKKLNTKGLSTHVLGLVVHRAHPLPALTHLAEPLWPTVLAVQPVRQRRQFVLLTAMTLVAVRTVAKHRMLVSDIAEPMNLLICRKQTQRNAVHGGIPPSLIKEAPGLVQKVKIREIRWRAPKVQIADFEIAPKVACAVSIRHLGVFGPRFRVCEPGERVVRVEVTRVFVEKRGGRGPQIGQGFWVVVDVDREAVCFVVGFHEPEHVVFDVAEKPVSLAPSLLAV